MRLPPAGSKYRALKAASVLALATLLGAAALVFDLDRAALAVLRYQVVANSVVLAAATGLPDPALAFVRAVQGVAASRAEAPTCVTIPTEAGDVTITSLDTVTYGRSPSGETAGSRCPEGEALLSVWAPPGHAACSTKLLYNFRNSRAWAGDFRQILTP